MTSMPEVAAEWQNFDQLAADKLYELLRFRHDLCDSKRFLELGCTIPGTINNPFLAGNRKFESASLQRAVCLSSELRRRKPKARHFAAVSRMDWEVRRDGLPRAGPPCPWRERLKKV
jgi:hypothetical protein